MLPLEIYFAVPFLVAVIAWALGSIVYICCDGSLLQLMQWWAFRNPYRDIGDYMGRWWVVEERGWLEGYGWCLGNKASHLKRQRPDLYGTYHGLFGIRLHHIRLPDQGDIHDHPWRFTTRILSGSYIERNIYGQSFTRCAGDKLTRQAHEFHKIESVSPGGCWTLFITGRRVNDWGFLQNGVKIPYKVYQHERFT